MMKLQSLVKCSKLLYWWAIIEILLLSLYIPVSLSAQCTSGKTEQEDAQCSVTNRVSFMDIILNGTQVNNTIANDTTGVSDACLIRPKCDEITGCNTHLYCFDFKKLSSDDNRSIIQEPPQTLLVTPHQLETIVENSAAQNVCAIVLFYAPWCAFSVQFARKFNALGRSFDRLPILAVDLAESEPYVRTYVYVAIEFNACVNK